MGLPWFRMDSTFFMNDKITKLVAQTGGYQAFFAWNASIGYATDQATDGFIPTHVLHFLQATKRSANMLVEHELWEPVDGGWRIRNFTDRQEMSIITDAKRVAQKAAAAKTNCKRYHGAECGCWQTVP